MQSLWVTVYALITALATGLGALPLALGRQPSDRWLGIGHAIAAGLMLTASFRLIAEGVDQGPWRTSAGICLGLLGIWLGDRLIDRYEQDHDIGGILGADPRKALLIMGVMTVHSAAEGIGVGVGFGRSEDFGLFIATAIAVHNIPEGLAIALVVVPRGVGILKAAGLAILSSLPQPLLALPAFAFVLWFEPVLPVGLGLAAGAMIWMVLSELLPDAYEKTGPKTIATTTTGTVVLMVLFQSLIAT